MEKIDKHQLFCIFMLYEIGSTTLFVLGISAKQDAWIADIFGTCSGLLLLWVYLQLQKGFPTKNLIEIITTLIGKVLGIPLALLYGFYFLEACVINFSEFVFLMNLTFLHFTPLLVVAVIFMLLIAFYLLWGLETISRTSELILPIVLIFIILIIILTISSGSVNLRNLQPVLGDGFMPVIQAVFPKILVFPFGEAVVFLMFWKHVNPIDSIRKTSAVVFLWIGLIITGLTVLIISVLGADYASISTIPLLQVITTIYILDIISNLTSWAVVIIFIGGFFKALLNLFGSVLAFSTTLKIKNKWVIFIACPAALWIAFATIPNLSYHRFLGQEILAPLIHPIFQIGIPFLLYMIFLIKKYILKIKFE